MLPALINREHEKAALRQAIQAKDKKMIEKLEAKIGTSEVTAEIVLYYNAFIELDSERQYAEGPIPASAIRAWCADYDLTFEQFDIMRVVIRVADNAVLNERGKKGRNGKPSQDRQDDGDGGNRRTIAGTRTDKVRGLADGGIPSRADTG